MTDRINLTQLRANTEAIRQGAERHDQAASMLTVDQALALIDAVEAAHTYANENGLIPNEPLAIALDRFDHT